MIAQDSKSIRISIDGPSASGKSTLGRMIADHLVISFFDAGLTYRAAALVLEAAKVNSESVARALSRISRSPYRPQDSKPIDDVFVDGESVLNLIWDSALDPRLRSLSTEVSARKPFVDFHRALVTSIGSVIVAGRDICVQVLPEAEPKVFLYAPLDVRRGRREQQLKSTPLASRQVAEGTDLDRGVQASVVAARGMVFDTSKVSLNYILTQILHTIQ
jgi:cytidylate kinase